MSALHDAMISLGRQLQAAGYQVGENPLFGGVAPVHATNSAHYSGDALDINFDGQGQAFETSKLQQIVPMAKALGLRIIWQTAGHFDHIHIDARSGPDIGNIGYTGASSPAPTGLSAVPAGLGPSMDEIADTVSKAVVIGLATATGVALVLIGLNKATGNPAAKAARAAI